MYYMSSAYRFFLRISMMRTIFTSSASTKSKPARNVRKGDKFNSQNNLSSKRMKKSNDLDLDIKRAKSNCDFFVPKSQ